MNNINDNYQRKSSQRRISIPISKQIPLQPIKGFADGSMKNRGLYPINYIKGGKNSIQQYQFEQDEGLHNKTKLSYSNNSKHNSIEKDNKANTVLKPIIPLKYKPNQCLPSIWNGKAKSTLNNITEVNGYNEQRPRSTLKKDVIKAKDIDSIYITKCDNNDSINQVQEGSTVVMTEYNFNTARMISHNMIGLDNLGNTCYMNTCLQNIIHCEPFISKLIKSKNQIEHNRHARISKCFYNLCMEIIFNSKGKRSVSPIDFKTSFSRLHSEFRGYGQHDTQECCRVLLDDISNELNVNTVKPKYKELDTNKKPKTQLKKEFTDYLQSRENSIVTSTFYGEMQTSYICKCGSESYTYQRFLDIPLLLPDGSYQSNGLELEDLLKIHFKEDSIKWDAKCPDCHIKTVHAKIMKLVDLPEILILSFQRYNSRTRTKNSAYIRYPLKIDLKQFVDLDCYNSSSSNSTQYHLIGISNHSGNVGFGHYYA